MHYRVVLQMLLETTTKKIPYHVVPHTSLYVNKLEK